MIVTKYVISKRTGNPIAKICISTGIRALSIGTGWMEDTHINAHGEDNMTEVFNKKEYKISSAKKWGGYFFVPDLHVKKNRNRDSVYIFDAEGDLD